MRLPTEVLANRLKSFQSKLRERQVDAVMLRTLSSFIYFAGVKWLRPALLIPAEGEPVAFVARGEEDGFRKRTWFDNVVTYVDGGDLMAKVSGLIRKNGYKVVGLEYGIERDAYILFFEVFKKLNPNVKVVDVSEIIAEMRLIKDEYELSFIRKAGSIATKALKKVLSVIKPGVTETDIAAEAYSVLYKSGSEEPHVYVNAGPDPRIHAEPLRDTVVRKETFVTIVVGADYNRYYVNASRTMYVGEANELADRALKCMDEAYRVAKDLTKPGRKFFDVIRELDKVYAKYGLINHRVVGYAHGVGLQVEEKPITTILVKDRFIEIKPKMVLALIHAPLVLKGLGQVKAEDTFIVGEDGELENVTKSSTSLTVSEWS